MNRSAKTINVFMIMGILSILFLSSHNVFSQGRGSISGTILDGMSNTTLPGATVSIDGTATGTTTDIHGRFVLTNVPAGKLTLNISFLGFNAENREIEIADDETTNISVELMPDILSLQEVVFSSQALGQSRAINQQLSSDAMVNIVSEEKLKELPDVNAAEALGRLPGVALQRNSGEGQKVLIRGMNPAFSAITINGVRLPSNDISDRSVNLSMISSESLAGIELFKSPTPDMDGESVGGTVNLLLKKAPDKTSYELRGGGGYNQLKNDWGNYNISGIFSTRILKDKFGLIMQANTERVNRGSELFGGTYTFLDVVFPIRFSLTDRMEIRERIGGSVNLDYRLPKGDITLYSYYGKTNRDVTQRSQTYDPFDFNTIRYGYTKTDIEMDIWSNMLSGEHNFQYFKLDWGASYAYTSNKNPNNREMTLWDDGAYAHNPAITRDFTQWADSARTDNTRAYLRDAYFNATDFHENNYSFSLNIDVPLKITNAITGNFKTGAKYRGLQRVLESQRLSEEFYYLGGEVVQKAINSHAFPLDLTANNRIAMSNFIGDHPYQTGTFLDDAYAIDNPINAAMISQWFEYQKNNLNEDRNALAENYDLTETVTAGYAMLKLEIFDQLTMISGLRIEESNNQYNAIASTLSGWYGINGALRDTTTTQKYTDLLPHLHLRYKPLEWFDIRLSYAKTLARPSFNMIIPRSSVNFQNARIIAGNPNLKHMESDNYDATLSFYNGKFGLLAISGFYKELKNIFFQVENYTLISDSIAESFGYPGRKDYVLNTFDNSPEATVFGFEIDLQTNMNFLPEPLNGFVLSANITRQFSETYKYSFLTTDSVYRNPDTGRIVRESFLEEDKRKIQMPGQSPFILNIALGYDLRGFSGRVSANYQDKYLIFPGSSALEDNINWNFWRFDIALKQKINTNLSVYLNLNNINNMREEHYRNNDINFPGSIQNYGPVFTFGIHYKI